MKDFQSLGLPRQILSALEKMNFTTPTPIQAQAIPQALQGRDILGSAQTGTGKTGAFGVPMLAHLVTQKQSMAIVIAPTRELAAQILKEMQKMLAFSPDIRAALLIGGESMNKQLAQLRQRPRLIVGTPGRINDHLQQGTLKLAPADFLVLDETDKMLDMGFEIQIDRILRHLPKRRQTLLFSATLPPRIVKLSDKYLNNPCRVAVGSTHAPAAKITQEQVQTVVAEKYNVLLAQLKARQGSVIVFVKTKRGADRMALKLNKEGHKAEAIHGNLSQNKRNRVIQEFRDKKHRIMVATDVAARGLDIPHIEHVINYDLPQVPEDYIHRIGRTARAGAEGGAVSILTPEDRGQWREIEFVLNPDLKKQGGERGAVAPLPRQGKAQPRNNGFGKKSFGKKDGPRGNGKPWRLKRRGKPQGGKSQGGKPQARAA